MVNDINTNEKPIPCNIVFATKYNLIHHKVTNFSLTFSRTQIALKSIKTIHTLVTFFYILHKSLLFTAQ